MENVIVEKVGEYVVEVLPKKQIKVLCEKNGVKLEKVFKIGDLAEYHSYNFSYYGEIVGIGPKSVTIQPPYSDKKERLNLYKFAWRNYDFDLEKKKEERANWSD